MAKPKQQTEDSLIVAKQIAKRVFDGKASFDDTLDIFEALAEDPDVDDIELLEEDLKRAWDRVRLHGGDAATPTHAVRLYAIEAGGGEDEDD